MSEKNKIKAIKELSKNFESKESAKIGRNEYKLNMVGIKTDLAKTIIFMVVTLAVVVTLYYLNISLGVFLRL